MWQGILGHDEVVEQFRQRFQLWLNQRWQQKDQLIHHYHQTDAVNRSTEQLPC